MKTRRSGFAFLVLFYSLIFFGCATDSSSGAPRDSDASEDTATDPDTSEASDTNNPGETNICTGITVDAHLASEENSRSPGTIGIVTWSLDGDVPDKAEIRFGLDTAYGMVAPVDLHAEGYRTLLLGMKPGRVYHYRVVAGRGEDSCTSADQTLETGPATNLVNLDVTVFDAEAHAEGFIITSEPGDFGPWQGDSIAYILDADGDIVWWATGSVGRVSRAMMSADGNSMWLVPDGGDFGSGPMEKIRMDTLESEKPGKVGASHDGTPVEGGTVAYIDYGEGDCGSVFELDEEGNTEEIFESSTYFPGLVPPECHMNAIHYNPSTGLYTVSDREHDIFLINRKGEVQWRLTDILSTDIYGAQQHGHQLLDESILLFANVGGKNEESSAALEYSLQDGSEIFRYEGDVFSVWLGDVQRLPNGNTLVTYSIAGKIREVDSGGNVVMEISGSSFGYSTWRPTLYGPPSN